MYSVVFYATNGKELFCAANDKKAATKLRILVINEVEKITRNSSKQCVVYNSYQTVVYNHNFVHFHLTITVKIQKLTETEIRESAFSRDPQDIASFLVS